MIVPKKISPDRIKDAIVEIRYVLNQPFEIALGMFFINIDDTYSYTNRPLANFGSIQSHPINQENVEIQFGSKPIFFNDKIKIEITPQSIIFNCLGDYILWENYFPEILKFLSQIIKAKVIESISRIGIRYISQYPNIDLRQCSKFTFGFGMPDLKSNFFSFRSEYNLDSYKIILNLSNLTPYISTNEKGELVTIPTSVIDIDVIEENLDSIDEGGIADKINSAHTKQKELFFSILNEDFLSTLTPIY